MHADIDYPHLPHSWAVWQTVGYKVCTIMADIGLPRSSALSQTLNEKKVPFKKTQTLICFDLLLGGGCKKHEGSLAEVSNSVLYVMWQERTRQIPFILLTIQRMHFCNAHFMNALIFDPIKMSTWKMQTLPYLLWYVSKINLYTEVRVYIQTTCAL